VARGSPYRSGSTSAPEEGGASEGLVDELIKQFADPLAFYRELVQNSLDAGASAIAVTLSWEPRGSGDDPQGALAAAVRDDGCGMDRETLEEQLMVLFRSTKDRDDTKIGKFGVGFVSVLAVDPELVTVRTSQGRGEQWTLQLSRDQSYELFRAEGGGVAGTTVTLLVPMRRSAFAEFVEGSKRALTKWCRHAEIPVRFVAHAPGAEPDEARIDRPFGIEGLVTVEQTGNDGRTRVVAALPPPGVAYLGFFNHGLLLHETTEPVFGAVAVKILDRGLQHTLSRDNVRKDAHYEQAIRFARHVVDEVLTARVRAVMEEVAEGRTAEPRIDRLHEAIVSAGLAISAREERFPLLHPRARRGSISARELEDASELYCAIEASAITEAAAAEGAIVLDSSAAEDPAAYEAMLQSVAKQAIPRAESVLTLATPIEAEPSDLVLLERTALLLDALGPDPRGLRLVALQGSLEDRAFVSGLGTPPRVLTQALATKSPFSVLGRPPLWLRAGAEIVRAAREAAQREPDLAAAMLARAVLLEHGLLDDAMDDAWMEHALEAIGGSP
jgi:hypothetical protein